MGSQKPCEGRRKKEEVISHQSLVISAVVSELSVQRHQEEGRRKTEEGIRS
ncbi:hypothetical protein [Microcoleus sp.]|uniref:hypothetical protein n=1 Tax=Microcoleus sp. TaxID=44472 RepID=UPI003592F584